MQVCLSWLLSRKLALLDKVSVLLAALYVVVVLRKISAHKTFHSMQYGETAPSFGAFQYNLQDTIVQW